MCLNCGWGFEGDKKVNWRERTESTRSLENVEPRPKTNMNIKPKASMGVDYTWWWKWMKSMKTIVLSFQWTQMSKF